MLTEERHHLILQMLQAHQSVTVSQLCQALGASESTIRRDLNALDRQGQLKKVHGGATQTDWLYATQDEVVSVRHSIHMAEKQRIGAAAAQLIEPDDFVYVDAGTTTECMVDALTHTGATFVTNGILLAKQFAQKGCTVYLPPGELKLATEALVGAQTVSSLQSYNFTKGFFGTNGITRQNGFSTPDATEAAVKAAALARCRRAYVLADPAKFGVIASVTFARFEAATIYTTRMADPAFAGASNLREVERP